MRTKPSRKRGSGTLLCSVLAVCAILLAEPVQAAPDSNGHTRRGVDDFKKILELAPGGKDVLLQKTARTVTSPPGAKSSSLR